MTTFSRQFSISQHVSDVCSGSMGAPLAFLQNRATSGSFGVALPILPEYPIIIVLREATGGYDPFSYNFPYIRVSRKFRETPFNAPVAPDLIKKGLISMKTNTPATQATTDDLPLPLIDYIVSGLCLQFKGQGHLLIDSRISEQFSETCPVCSRPACKVMLDVNKTAYMHNVLIRDGVDTRADYCPARLNMRDFR